MIKEKVLNSIAQRGVAGTGKRVLLYGRDLIRWYLDASFDRRHKVGTSGKIPLSAFKIDSEHLEEATWYEPVPTLAFRQLMRGLKIKFEDYVFIDFGSGKGRALFLAADYPFSRVIGVEFSPELHAVALRNIGTYTSSRQRCFQIESLCVDAVDFELPPVQSVLFFYSPFKASIFVRVLANVMSSLEKYPRSVYLLFVGMIPESIEILKNSNLSCREMKLGPDYIRWEKKAGLILHNRISED